MTRKEVAEQAKRQLSLDLGEMYMKNNVKQDSEGYATGTDQTVVSKWQDPDSDRNIAAALIPLSLVKHDLMDNLAQECGGTYVKGTGQLNGTTKDEQANVLDALAEITRCTDTDCEKKQWLKIERAAAKALKELRK